MVLAALSGEGGAAFKHASTTLRANKPFVLAAARGCGDPYSVALFAAESLVHDHEFMAEVMEWKNIKFEKGGGSIWVSKGKNGHEIAAMVDWLR